MEQNPDNDEPQQTDLTAQEQDRQLFQARSRSDLAVLLSLVRFRLSILSVPAARLEALRLRVSAIRTDRCQ
jgi:hypothetical protein